MKRILLAAVLLLSVTGCSYLQSIDSVKAISYAIDSTVLVSSLIELDSTVTVARVSINENRDKFNVDEWGQLKLAGERIDSLREQFSRIFGPDVDVKTRILSSVKLKQIVGDVFDTYDNVEQIVLLHAEQFTPEQRLQVLTAKRTINSLQSSYEHIKATARANDGETTIDATELMFEAIKAIKKIARVFIDKE